MALILIVDDVPSNRDLAAELLTLEEYEVAQAENGQQALEFVARRRPDLILMDLRMPVMDGVEATRRLKADAATRSIPILALTASVMVGERERILREGFDGFITKPIDFDELLDGVARALEEGGRR
ncbi:MAG: response regulator [Zetaproteobacteria bacterium]|nr:MAG: response regulator [Zetaproteobacteria bacterium]